MGVPTEPPTQSGGRLVPPVGVEPTWSFPHDILSVARIPVPPRRHIIVFGADSARDGLAEDCGNSDKEYEG